MDFSKSEAVEINSYEDIQRMVQDQISESDILEFKSEFNNSMKADLLKDLVALANTRGGYLIFGVATKSPGDVASKVLGLEKDDSKSLQNFIEEVCSNDYAIKPPIKFDLKSCELPKSNKEIVVARITEGNKKPHVVWKFNSTPYYSVWVRIGSTNRPATPDIIRKLCRDKEAIFKPPISSERKLALENGEIRSVIRDGVLFQNLGSELALNVTAWVFLNVLITQQELLLLGDIPGMGEVPLSYLDPVIDSCRYEINRILNERNSRTVSHELCILIEFEDVDGNQFSQPVQAGISWAYRDNEYVINIGSDKNESFRIIPTKEPLGHVNEVDYLIDKWKQSILSRQIHELDNIDDIARKTAWKLYNTGAKDASKQVHDLFTACQSAQEIQQGLSAATRLEKLQHRQINLKDLELLVDRIADGANAARKPPYNNVELEQQLWELFGRYERRLSKFKFGR